MEKDRKTKYFLLAAGSLMVGASGSVVGTYAFQGETLYVFLGYIIFVLAYKTCWYGVQHSGGLEGLRQLVKEGMQETVEFTRKKPWNYLLILAGLYLTSYGTVQFTTLVENPELVTGLKTGAACFGGYVLAHEGVNEVPL